MFQPWESILATNTVHALEREVHHHRTILVVKFHGYPPPDPLGLGRRTRQQATPWVAGFFHFSAISSQPIPPLHHFWIILTHFRGPFLQIHHRLNDTTKRNSADSSIEFFGHHSNLWTKVRVLVCSWSLKLSIDMWLVNFGRRLVSFQFLGCFG